MLTDDIIQKSYSPSGRVTFEIYSPETKILVSVNLRPG